MTKKQIPFQLHDYVTAENAHYIQLCANYLYYIGKLDTIYKCMQAKLLSLNNYIQMIIIIYL